MNSKLPKITCPDIDRLIKSVKAIEKVLKMRIDTIDEAIGSINEIEYEVSGFEDRLEELRDANRTLREVAERADDLEDQVDELEKQIVDVDYEAIGWALEKLHNFGVTQNNMENAMMADRLELMLKLEQAR